MPSAQPPPAYRRSRPVNEFYAWLVGMGLDVVDIRVRLAITDGRYEPDDPREVNPHARPGSR